METSNITALMEINLTTIAEEAATTPMPLWSQVINNLKLTIAIIGIIANIATIIALTVSGEGFSDLIKMLLKYQSLLDCFACLEAALLIYLPPMVQTGFQILDLIICQVWYSQAIYWETVALSIHNLVTLALERYLCVCHPLKYNTMTKTHFRIVIVAIFIFCTIQVLPGFFQTRYSDGKCLSEFYWEGKATELFFSVYGIFSFCFYYANPCACFFIFYGLIIISFHRRAKKNLGASGSSSVIDNASSQLTKTAMVVTIIFIITIGVDSWYYMLAYAGIIKYIMNSPLQKVGVFFSVVNSVVNPFVYAALMPVYRRSVKKTFLSRCSNTA